MFHEGEQSGLRFRVHHEGQVVRLAADDAYGPALAARPREAAGASRFVSGAMLALKAKQVDDGLYAAVELAAQHGVGPFAGKRALLEAVLGHGPRPDAGEARSTLEAAASLGEGRACEPGRPAEIRDQFLADDRKSKPLGFYTWTEELTRIFRQDRLLQSDLRGAADLAALAEVLRADARLRASYEACLRLPERLTNALACSDLRRVMASLDAGRAIDTRAPVAILPPSKAHETELVKRLYGDRPIPADFDLSNAMIGAIHRGELDLTPSESSGWYDVQTWALETLAAPERGPEAKSLELAASYRTHLEDLFRGILTATRETHVKQLEAPLAGCGMPREVKLQIAPHLTVEPLVTYFQRRADSYRFVRALLAETFGEEALGSIHGLRRDRRVAQPIGAELAAMIHLFDGAAATGMRELGIPTTWDHTTFDAWRGGEGDPDVDEDIRAMVPVFFDVERRKSKVWMFLGWSQRSLTASFAKPPRVEVLGGTKAEIELSRSWYPIATPIMVEAYVSRLLDRDEFRALCNQHRTKEAILAAVA
jgi:hypothetical protein